jgi:hypothetical protein
MDNNPAGAQAQPQKSPPVTDQELKQASPQQTRQELREAIVGSNEVLVTARTTLALFPDTLVLDRAKLTVVKRSFFSSAELMSLRIEDVSNVTATIGPFLGVVQVTSRVMNTGPYEIGKFWRHDALRIKRITQGYVIALQRNIDCSALPTNELVYMLDKLGEDDHANATV